MSDENVQLKNAFIIAQNPSDEQKRQHEIRMVNNKNRRDSLETMVRYRDQQIKREERRLEERREHIYRKELCKKVKAKSEMHLVMKGVTPPSVKTQADAVRRSVENKYGPLHAAQINKLKGNLNRQIDRHASAARALDTRPSQSKKPPAKSGSERQRQEKTSEPRRTSHTERRSEFRSNAKQVTQRSSKSDSKGGSSGKSGSGGRGR